MANTYATIANGGQRADVHVIEKVDRQRRRGRCTSTSRTRTQAIEPDIDRDVSYAMQQVVQHGTGANAQAIDRPAAGKTGTATNANGEVSSSWFVGLHAAAGHRGDVRPRRRRQRARRLAAAVQRAAGYFGAGYPTATWAAVMKRDLEGVPVEEFPPPANVDRRPRPRPATRRRPAASAAERRHQHHVAARRPTSSAPTQPADRRRAPPTEPSLADVDARPTDQQRPPSAAARPARRARTTSPRSRARRPAVAMAVARSRGGDRLVAGDGTPTAGRCVRPDPGRPGRRRAEPRRRRPGRASTPGGTLVDAGARASSALTAVCFALGMVQKAPCYDAQWTNSQSRYSRDVLLRPALPLRRARVRRAGLALLRLDRRCATATT